MYLHEFVAILHISFDLQLENFGVNTSEISQPVRRRLFHAWIEDWEKDLLKKNDCVAEARLLEKYKDLVFFDPDNEILYTVSNENLDFHRGGKGGWFVIGIPADDKYDDEPFKIADWMVKLIAEHEQEPHIRIIQPTLSGCDV